MLDLMNQLIQTQEEEDRGQEAGAEGREDQAREGEARRLEGKGEEQQVSTIQAVLQVQSSCSPVLLILL